MSKPNSSMIRLQSARIDDPCSESWHEMSGGHKVRYCEKCDLHVHNLVTYTESEAQALFDTQVRGERLCVRANVMPDGKFAYVKSVWDRLIARLDSARRFRRLATALAAAIGVFASGCYTSIAGGIVTGGSFTFTGETWVTTKDDYQFWLASTGMYRSQVESTLTVSSGCSFEGPTGAVLVGTMPATSIDDLFYLMRNVKEPVPISEVTVAYLFLNGEDGGRFTFEVSSDGSIIPLGSQFAFPLVGGLDAFMALFQLQPGEEVAGFGFENEPGQTHLETPSETAADPQSDTPAESVHSAGA